jgi:tetraacyldisaccharide 4'-kinase
MKPNTAYRIPQTALSLLLSPFSFLFGLIAALRRRTIRTTTFSVPTICVGNLRVGGTGKTPHVEYIARFLSQNYQVAILSRGYGRKTKGYISANETQNLISKIIGDEPMQYATKFPNVEVAVCEKRKTGIEKLLHKNPKLDVVVLDDAYQHLSVNYSLRILLTEYHRPFFEDFPLPSGTLRECRNASKHADIIIVTKCPENITENEKSNFIKKLKPRPHQNVFFTKIAYLTPQTPYLTPLLITGIANPAPLVQYLKTQNQEIHSLHFPDHHPFTNKDIEKIIRLKEKLGGENCTIVTTEKDAMRLQAFENMPEYYTIPIEIAFLENEAGFKEKLLSLLKEH